MQQLATIATVGLLVGAGSACTGLGAGLAFPVLAWLGLPLHAALLAVKLPVAASDLAAGFAPTADPATGAPPWRWQLLAGAALAGALAALAMLRLPGPVALALLAVLACAAVLLPRSSNRQNRSVALWATYIGACGVGCGWLQRASAWWHGDSWIQVARSARQLGAAANLGAVAVLAGAGQSVGSVIWVLALAQAIGAWSAVSLQRRLRSRRDRRLKRALATAASH